MRWIRTALSLRSKITASFTLIVVGGTVVSTLIGSRIITTALLNQARMRGRQGLEAARIVYGERLSAVKEQTVRTGSSDVLLDAVRSGSAEALEGVLDRARAESGLSFLTFVDARTRRAVRAGDAPSQAPVPPALEAVVKSALAGKTVASTEVLDHDGLEAESPTMAGEAVVTLVPAPNGRRPLPHDVTSGLVLVSATPLRLRGTTVGVLYGGILLNRHNEIVDRVEQLVYGAEKYKGRQIGTVSIFLGDVRISTNVREAPGERAVGTTLSPEIALVVLTQGQSWSGRAYVVDDWYVATYEPIRNSARAVIGALYVGILEEPFLAARTEVMLTFLVVCALGLVIVFVLTYVLTLTMIHPLEEMVAATKRIATGDLDVTVNVASRDEIGELATSFNNMLASLKTMNSELQEWAHTLEEKVRQRTDELVAVQARMAQSEKLASIGRLAAGVAHGINNPLGGILSLTMLALEDCGPDHPLRNDLDTIVKQTLRCREIVKGLLDFSRQSETRATRTAINPIIDGTLSLLERQAIFQNIRTVRILRDDLPPVLIDPGQLQEVAINIVLNAVDAMEENGEITVETRLNQRAGEVVIRISDTGKGIAPEVMPFIFEPFFTTKKVGQGTGLGLAIVHGIVTRAGGRVEVASSPSGTTFIITLPVAPEESQSAAVEAVGRGAGQPAGG